MLQKLQSLQEESSAVRLREDERKQLRELLMDHIDKHPIHTHKSGTITHNSLFYLYGVIAFVLIVSLILFFTLY